MALPEAILHLDVKYSVYIDVNECRLRLTLQDWMQINVSTSPSTAIDQSLIFVGLSGFITK